MGQVKDAQAVLAAYLDKRLKLTILVADIPASYGMILSRTFCKDLRGEIKMDWSEVVIPVGNRWVKLEPKVKNKFIVFPSDNPKAHILFEETEFGNYLIFSTDEKKEKEESNITNDSLWIMEFDGSCASSGSGARVVLISSQGDIIPFSFKLDFKNTNNTIEYEVLLLGISEAKNKGIKLLREKGDVELIVKQVRTLFSTKSERLKHYRNMVWDEIEFFDAFSIEVMPREQNTRANSLVVSASLLLPHPDFKEDTYRVEMIYRPSVPNNVQNWQVSEGDAQIRDFLECT